jgi:small conductance mechanosensitive channel
MEDATELGAQAVEQAGRWIALGQELATQYGLKLLAAVVILIIGRWVAKWLRGVVRRMMERSQVDPMIIGFVSSIAYIGLMVFVVVAALGQLGIQTTSFIAILGAAGLAIGLALQGSLANFAAGFLMIVFRPFKVGDFIEGGGVAGTVEAIEIFTTTLKTPDNKIIIVPNAKISGDNIVNYSTQPTRRVELTVGASYDADIRQVREVLEGIVRDENRILDEPAPFIAVKELADNSVNFVVRVWTATGDYWGVYFDMTEQVKLRFDQAGIGIPYPQRDVHVYEHKAA